MIDFNAIKQKCGTAPVDVRLGAIAMGKLGPCPFHEDSTPSFGPYQSSDGTPRWKCFGCNFEGDVFSVISQLDGITTVEAAKLLEKNKQAISATIPPVPAHQFKWDLKRLEKAVTSLECSKDAQAFLASRGIDFATIMQLQFGFENPYIIIPTFDGEGKLCSIKLRQIPPIGQYKWMKANRDKGVQHLFNKLAVNAGADIIIVESELDAALLFSHGLCAVSVENAGHKLTDADTQLLKTASRILIGTDNDKAGEECAKHLLGVLGEKCFRIKAGSFKDFGDLYMSNPEGFSTAFALEIENAVPLSPVIKDAGKIAIPDMSEEVLDGWLGKVCKERMSAFPIALAWPALLSAASVLVPHNSNKGRANLFTVLVGGKGTGKSCAFDYALQLLAVKSPPLLRWKVGSAEQLCKKIGNVNGASRLYYTDELEHLLLKASILGASFATVLNTAFYEDAQDLTIAGGTDASMNCRLSLAGGVVDDRFNDLFGACTTGGFYDRFIFGVCPSDYAYNYRSFTGEPALDENNITGTDTAERPVPVEIDHSVWDARDRIAEALKIRPADRRVLELGIRCAVIAASLDGRRTLYGTDLGPMKAFIKYQLRVRTLLKPNPGKNTNAIVGCKFRDYLDDHLTKDNEWLSRREMIRSTHTAIDWGIVTCNSVLKAMEMAGEIETNKIGRQHVLRRIV